MFIHFIGICGVAMSALAIACKKAGFRVSGSDAGFFPPVSSELERHSIDFYPGWHPEQMTRYGNPDLVVVGNVASSTNPEWLTVQEKKIPYQSYPEFVADHIVKKHSIVCAGTYGKTTTSALLSHLLIDAGMSPSYLFGGLTIGAMDSAAITKSEYSVLEGDEYKSARWDVRPKFEHYAPTHLLLTGISWDHADIYPTEQSYQKTFENLVASIPSTGCIIACVDNETVRHAIQKVRCRIITYGASEAEYLYSPPLQTTNGISFDIQTNHATHRVRSPMLGAYHAANITGAFAMAEIIGIPIENILTSIQTFHGLRRRLEKRFDGNITIFDDIAHSPRKARATLETIRDIYPKKIIAIFEPNAGNRTPGCEALYDHAFDAANHIIIPKLTKIKNSETVFNGAELARIIRKTHTSVEHIPNDVELIAHVQKRVHAGDAVVFLGSHGFRGMIEALIEAQKT